MSIARVIASLVMAALLVSLGISTVGVAAGISAVAPLQTATSTFVPGTGAIAGSAWDDADGDGFRSLGELPLVGMVVNAQSGQISATVTTTVDGSYRLVGLPSGGYTLTATPPYGYEMTTPARLDIWVADGGTLNLDFGARFVPTPTPTPTEPPILDVHDAQRTYCGGIYQGDTSLTGRPNVNRYSCRAAWDESGPEVVYRIELDARQPVSVTFLSVSVDLDLFLLRYAYPNSCVASGDSYLTYVAEPGVYFLAVDGYQGATGAFAFRVDCAFGAQASPTPTHTPSPTFTVTPTYSPSPTFTPSPAPIPRQIYLPLVVRA